MSNQSTHKYVTAKKTTICDLRNDEKKEMAKLHSSHKFVYHVSVTQHTTSCKLTAQCKQNRNQMIIKQS